MPSSWNLDKRVPVALIATIIAQAAPFIWWAAKTDAQMNNNTTRIGTLERTLETNVQNTQDFQLRTVEALTDIKAIQRVQTESLKNIDKKL